MTHMPPVPTIASVRDDYLSYLRDVRGRAPNTVRAYAADLRAAGAALPGDLTALDHRAIEAWLATVPSPATRQRRLASLGGLCVWALREDLITRDPTALITVAAPDTALPRPIPHADLARLDAAIAVTAQPYRLIVTILRETGMRASEALGLNAGDVTLDAGREALRIVGAKNNTDRTVVLTPDATPRTLRGLRAWLRVEPRAPHTPLFVSARGTRVSYDALEYQWRALCAVADMGAITLHQLRHTVATDLIADLPEHIVSRVLGHKDPRSTRRYAEVSEAQVRAALSRRRT